MLQNFRGKNIRDTETAQETLIPGIHLKESNQNKTSSSSTLSITNQQLSNDNLDAYIEKRK